MISCTVDALGRYAEDGLLTVTIDELHGPKRLVPPSEAKGLEAGTLSEGTAAAQEGAGLDFLPLSGFNGNDAGPDSNGREGSQTNNTTVPEQGRQHIERTGAWAALYAQLQAKKKACTPVSRSSGMTRGAAKPRPGARRAALGPLLSLLREEDTLAG